MIRMTWPQYLRGECQVGEFAVHLYPQEAEVMLALLLRYPGEVDIKTLTEMVWPDPDEQPLAAAQGIRDLVRRLRAKIGAFRIVHYGFTGYALVQRPGDCQAMRKVA